jgi:hypothetical protein
VGIKICFLVAAHSRPQVLLRSFESIYASNHIYLLHVDRKFRGGELAAVAEALCIRPNVSEVPSRAVSWGGFSQVDSELSSVQLTLQLRPPLAM